MEAATMKTCTKCGEEKALSEYYKSKDETFGVRGPCKICFNKYTKERYKTLDKKDLRRKAREYFRKNKDKIYERRAAYRQENIETMKQKELEYRKKNRKAICAIQKKWSNKNKQYQKNWQRKNKEKMVAYAAKRKARKASLPGHFTAAEFTALCEKYNNRCVCCGKKNKLEADHVIPVTWKGSTNYIENIQPLCSFCNSSKRNYHATDYR